MSKMRINNRKRQFNMDQLKFGIKRDQFKDPKMLQIFDALDGCTGNKGDIAGKKDGIIDEAEIKLFKKLIDIKKEYGKISRKEIRKLLNSYDGFEGISKKDFENFLMQYKDLVKDVESAVTLPDGSIKLTRADGKIEIIDKNGNSTITNPADNLDVIEDGEDVDDEVNDKDVDDSQGVQGSNTQGVQGSQGGVHTGPYTETDAQGNTLYYSADGKLIGKDKTVDGRTYHVDYDGNGNTVGVVVQNGEHVSDLAKKFGVSVQNLLDANKGLVHGSAGHEWFKVGEEIKVPKLLEPDDPNLINRKSKQEAINDFNNAMNAIKADIEARPEGELKDCQFDTYEDLAKDLFKQEGIDNPTKAQIYYRKESLKALNPDVKDGELKGKDLNVKVKQEVLDQWNAVQGGGGSGGAGEAGGTGDPGEHGGGGEIPPPASTPLTPEQLAQKEKIRKEGEDLAKEIFDIADSNSAGWSLDKINEAFKNKLNADNVVAFLDAYDTIDKGSDTSVLDTITSEVVWGDLIQYRKPLETIMTTLAEAAKKAGVSEEDITKAKTDFNNALDYEYKLIVAGNRIAGMMNVKDMEKAIDFLRGAISAKEKGGAEISTAEAIESVKTQFEAQHDSAQKANDDARANEGWVANFGDWLCSFCDCTTTEELAAKLRTDKYNVDRLMNAKTENDFKFEYKQIFGIEFDPNKLAAAKTVEQEYNTASMLETAMEMKRQGATAENVEAMLNAVGVTDSDVIALIKSNISKDLQTLNDEFRQVAKGRTTAQIANEYSLVSKSVFGTNDIIKDVEIFNRNMMYTELVTEIGIELAATAILAVIPGLGEAAAAKLAISVAKMGKIAKLANKAISVTRHLNVGKKATMALGAKGGNFAKAANIMEATHDIWAPAATMGAVTFAVNKTDGKDLWTSLEKAGINALFAGSGASVAKLSKLLKPVLIAKFPNHPNIASVATTLAMDISETALNLGIAKGIVTMTGGEYTIFGKDGFRDLLIMTVFQTMGHLSGGKAPAANTKTSGSVEDLANNYVQAHLSANNVAAARNAQRQIREALKNLTPEQRAAFVAQLKSNYEKAANQILNEKDLLLTDPKRRVIVDYIAGEDNVAKLEQLKDKLSKMNLGQDSQGNKLLIEQALDKRITHLNRMPQIKAVDEILANSIKNKAELTPAEFTELEHLVHDIDNQAEFVKINELITNKGVKLSQEQADKIKTALETKAKDLKIKPDTELKAKIDEYKQKMADNEKAGLEKYSELYKNYKFCEHLVENDAIFTNFKEGKVTEAEFNSIIEPMKNEKLDNELIDCIQTMYNNGKPLEETAFENALKKYNDYANSLKDKLDAAMPEMTKLTNQNEYYAKTIDELEASMQANADGLKAAEKVAAGKTTQSHVTPTSESAELTALKAELNSDTFKQYIESHNSGGTSSISGASGGGIFDEIEIVYKNGKPVAMKVRKGVNDEYAYCEFKDGEVSQFKDEKWYESAKKSTFATNVNIPKELESFDFLSKKGGYTLDDIKAYSDKLGANVSHSLNANTQKVEVSLVTTDGTLRVIMKDDKPIAINYEKIGEAQKFYKYENGELKVVNENTYKQVRDEVPKQETTPTSEEVTAKLSEFREELYKEFKISYDKFGSIKEIRDQVKNMSVDARDVDISGAGLATIKDATTGKKLEVVFEHEKPVAIKMTKDNEVKTFKCDDNGIFTDEIKPDEFDAALKRANESVNPTTESSGLWARLKHGMKHLFNNNIPNDGILQVGSEYQASKTTVLFVDNEVIDFGSEAGKALFKDLKKGEPVFVGKNKNVMIKEYLSRDYISIEPREVNGKKPIVMRYGSDQKTALEQMDKLMKNFETEAKDLSEKIKDLEKNLAAETDATKKQTIQKELDGLQADYNAKLASTNLLLEHINNLKTV